MCLFYLVCTVNFKSLVISKLEISSDYFIFMKEK